ncbi:MAG: hypothetical protein MUE85_22795 [Microscillaceae bacterium]|jgi:hypothetical protein|nr:hypothetical protein [Microscillaceae bacterium]
MEILHQNTQNTARTIVERDKGYYLMYAEGVVNDEDFRGGFKALLDDFKNNTHKIPKIIINIKKVSSTPMISRAWLVSSYLPELYKTIDTNLQIGLINTTSFFEGTTISLLVTTIQTLGFNLGIKFYKDVEEAQKGLGII